MSQNVPTILNWQPSWLYEFGVTRYFDNGWHVSAGYVYNENSVPDAHYTPMVADLDRHFFSVGTGHKGKVLILMWLTNFVTALIEPSPEARLQMPGKPLTAPTALSATPCCWPSECAFDSKLFLKNCVFFREEH